MFVCCPGDGDGAAPGLENYTGIKDFDPKKPEMGKFTYNRCIEHTDRLEAKNFESVMASCIKDPAKHEHTKTLKALFPLGSAICEIKQTVRLQGQSVTCSAAYVFSSKRVLQHTCSAAYVLSSIRHV